MTEEERAREFQQLTAVTDRCRIVPGSVARVMVEWAAKDPSEATYLGCFYDSRSGLLMAIIREDDEDLCTILHWSRLSVPAAPQGVK